ncbi:MAG: hypothetical protein C5B59_04210 [Bacteroidetes bacterium]|nr:MAG: hypothetical protein C5B59_04210 [Bacteroidota bacterium]
MNWKSHTVLPQGGIRRIDDIDQLLVMSTAFSCLLVFIRILYTGRITFLSLVWNLFLACVPYLITRKLHANSFWKKSKLIFVFLFIVWLLFIPNSFYIITDLFHLIDSVSHPVVPVWFSLLLIFSFAWNGLVMGILSVRQMEKMVGYLIPKLPEHLFVYPIMCLNAFGVYIGRWLRYNSWDVVANPFQLLGDALDILVHPYTYRYAWSIILCFSIFMTLMYLAIKRIAKSFN